MGGIIIKVVSSTFFSFSAYGSGFSDMGKWVNESMGSIMDAMSIICLVFSVVTLLIYM